MRCSGCGKDIPFTGSVCPFCQRDKSKDQGYVVIAFIFGLAGAVIGGFIFGVWGTLVGAILGCIAAVVIASGHHSEPPEVKIVNTQAKLVEVSTSEKLVELKKMHENGLLSDEEYSAKKSEILAKF